MAQAFELSIAQAEMVTQAKGLAITDEGEIRAPKTVKTSMTVDGAQIRKVSLSLDDVNKTALIGADLDLA